MSFCELRSFFLENIKVSLELKTLYSKRNDVFFFYFFFFVLTHIYIFSSSSFEVENFLPGIYQFRSRWYFEQVIIYFFCHSNFLKRKGKLLIYVPKSETKNILSIDIIGLKTFFLVKFERF